MLKEHSVFNKHISLFSSLLFLIFGCNSTLLFAQKNNEPQLENSLLWEISGKDLSKKSYLFGTIHMINEADYFWTPAMNTAFEKSELIVFELNTREMTDLSNMMGMFDQFLMKGDTTLRDILSEEDYGLLEDHFQTIGMPLMLFERMKPFFLTILLDPATNSFGEGGMKSYELELTALADKGEKDVKGLETIEFQAAIFDKIPYTLQGKMLIDQLKNKDAEVPGMDLDEMTKLYKEQNLMALSKAISGEESEIEGFEKIMLEDRNEAWIPKMQNLMQDKTVFFAVGAGHLPGEKGVINLLRKEGYTLTPIK